MKRLVADLPLWVGKIPPTSARRAPVWASLLAVALALSVGCSKKKEPPVLELEPATFTQSDDTDDEPLPVGPDLGRLQADVRKVLPELKQHVAAGQKKRRAPPDCAGDFLARQKKLNTIAEAVLGEPSSWVRWNGAQRDIADDLNTALMHARACVDCSPEDLPECSKATERLRQLEARL